ncbi:MAG TPA: hypothetical protein VJQ43_06850 [Thermoplasmata archaeon]|nr:hypothetical protein [Thermoplasmata archaeon]
MFRGPVALASGNEWHSEPFPLSGGDIVHARAESEARFYAGLFDEAKYQEFRTRNPNAFPFRFGTDERLFDRAYSVPSDGPYRFVLRVGGWTRPTSIQLTIRRVESGPASFRATQTGQERLVEPRVRGTVATGLASGVVDRTGRARLVLAILSAGSIVLLVALVWLDALVYQAHGLDSLDSTLSAEAAVLGVVLAMVGGLVAAYTYLGPKAGGGGP